MHISETDRGFHSKPITLTSIILGFGCTNFDCIRVWRAQFCAAGWEGKGAPCGWTSTAKGLDEEGGGGRRVIAARKEAGEVNGDLLGLGKLKEIEEEGNGRFITTGGDRPASLYRPRGGSNGPTDKSSPHRGPVFFFFMVKKVYIFSNRIRDRIRLE